MNTVAVVPKSKMSHGKINWKSGPAIKQYFPFHDNLIHYITMNPSSPKTYNKLIQCCKYFFDANPILVVAKIYELSHPGKTGRTTICPLTENKYFYGILDKSNTHIDIGKTSSKIWLLESLKIYGNGISNFLFLLRKNLYRYEIVELKLCETTIAFDDFKFLVQTVKKLSLERYVEIICNDGKILLLDEILEGCPKIESFVLKFYDPTDLLILGTLTLKNISKIPNLSNLKKFEMKNVPEIFAIQDVSDFMIKSLMNTEIMLLFGEGISEEYKSQLDALRQKLDDLQNEYHFIVYWRDLYQNEY